MKIDSARFVQPQVSVRWLAIACFEIRIGDFTLVIDPCVGICSAVDYGIEVVDKADLILISHGHWDHITDLQELMERSGCPVLAGEMTAPSLIRVTNANPAMIYPMTPNLELNFGGAKVRALFARHTNQRTTLDVLKKGIDAHPWNNTPDRREVNFYGNLEYRNYLITAPSGMKVLFWGSNVTPDQIAMVRELQPDIALLQYTKQQPQELAALAEAGNIKVILPHHMDLTQSEETYFSRIDALEEQIRLRAPGCAVIHPEHLKWYHFGLGMYAE